MRQDDFFEFAEDSSEVQHETPYGYRIYVVDDDEGVLKTTRDALENFLFRDEPLQISYFRSAAETIAALSSDDAANPKVAVILLDVVMKDMGFDVINYLRNKKDNYVTQIILRTGQAGKQIQDENQIIQKYEINDFIDKGESGFSRIRTAVATSLRMYLLLQSLDRAGRNLDMFNAGLLSFFNLKKEKSVFTEEDTDLMAQCIFGYLNASVYGGKKSLSPEALVRLREIKADNIQLLYVILHNALRKSKGDTVHASDIKPSAKESRLIWEKDESWLVNLCRALSGAKVGDMTSSAKLISSDTDPETFKEHHTGNNPITPIMWLGNLSDLLYLYYALHKENYIAQGVWEIIHKELEMHYCQKSGMLNSDTLKTYKAKYKFTRNEISGEGKIIRTEEWVWDTPNRDIIDDIILNIEE